MAPLATQFTNNNKIIKDKFDSIQKIPIYVQKALFS